MKRMFSLVLTFAILVCCTCMMTFGSSDTSSLDDVIESNTGVSDQGSQSQGPATSKQQEQADREARNQNFIAGLTKASDLTTEVEGVEEATSWIRLIASWIVQVLSYALTALLAVRVVLDLVYIGLPFTRTFLANGFQGNAQAGAGGMPNSMMGGQPGMSPMGGAMGGYGGYGGARGGYGGYGAMGGAMGGPMGGAMGGPMGNTSMANQQGSMMGRIQWVSNAALNAVASESTVGPDGGANTPFKAYIKDMFLVLVLVPVLITLAVTGALTNLGFMIGNLLCDAIASIGDMI